MSKAKVVSLEQFKKAPRAPSATDPESDEALTAPGRAFRERFLAALSEMESEVVAQLAVASKASDVKMRINTSAALKCAQASPLTAYSDLHREVVAAKVKEAQLRCEQAIKAKFKVSRARPTIESLQKQLAGERAAHAQQLSQLASQKMTEYLRAVGRK